VHLVDLSLGQILLVLVTSNGVVEKHSMDISKEVFVAETELDEANHFLSKHLRGFRLSSLPEVPISGNANVDYLVKEVEKTLTSLVQSKETVYVGGTSVLAGSLTEPEGIRKVLDLLERQMIVVSLIRGVIDRGLSVVIGTETGVDHLAECSLVVAPYEIDGEAAGSIGILGPTRMDYTQALATVGIVGRSLGDHLTEG
jgi:heat-inducible transcriptional repressor